MLEFFLVGLAALLICLYLQSRRAASEVRRNRERAAAPRGREPTPPFPGTLE